MIAGTKDERRPVKPQSARFRGVPSDSSRLTSLHSPPNLHADAILFRNRSGNPYRQDTLADDFGTLREAIFPGEKRRLMDMHRSGTLEAIAGGAEGFALAAKMANSIENSNALHRTYSPVDEVAVENVDEARLRGRRKLRVVNKTGRKV